MIDVKRKNIVEFQFSHKNDTNDLNQLALESFLSPFCTIMSDKYVLSYADHNGQFISKQDLTTQLELLRDTILSHDHMIFSCLEPLDYNTLRILDFFNPFIEFLEKIYLLENVNIYKQCYYALGNLAIAKHIITIKEVLVTPIGTFDEKEINSHFEDFKYHQSWDWLMPIWPELRKIAHRHDLLMNKQIDDTFGISIQVFEPNGKLTQFQEEHFTGIESLWKTFAKYVQWFDHRTIQTSIHRVKEKSLR